MNDMAPFSTDDTAIWRPSAALNPQRLEYLWGLTDRLAWSTSVPESLRGERNGGKFESFDDRTVLANVFAVVEQADRWNVSPFALLGSAAIVRGKLAFEGKVIAAVLEAQFHVSLFPYYRGKPGTDDFRIYLCDEELPDDVLGKLEPGYRHDRYKIMDGSVGDWKTTGNGSPWRPATYADQLVYRGTRQWARVYRAAAIMGVLADDEVQAIDFEQRAQAAIPTTAQRFSAPDAARQGFDPKAVAKQIEQNSTAPMELLDTSTGELVPQNTEAQSASPAKQMASGRKADPDASSAAPASEEPSTSHVDGGPGNADSGTRAQQDNNAAADDKEGGAPLPRSFFENYSGALVRSKSTESLTKADSEFAKANAIKPSAKELDLLKTIYKAHEDRIKGGLDAGKVLNDIRGWIAEDVPEDKL